MNDYELKVEMLSRFARPTLFDAVKQPEMLVAMILANLMSPSLWLFKAQVQSHIPVDPMPERSHVKLIMSAIKSYVDRHLFHASPKEIGEIWGLLDLDEERKRLGVDTIDYSIDLIVTDLRGRQRRGQLTEKQNIFPLIDNGTFPEYDYSTIDSIKAYRRILKRKKHKPIGVSCCADEAVLIASLACVLHGARLRDILIFGSPVHYTTLVEHKQQLFWFNGKHECFDGGAWCAEVGGKSVIDSQEPFDARITFERLISPLGKYVFAADEMDLSATDLQQIFSRFYRFFGGDLRQIVEVKQHQAKYCTSVSLAACFDALDQAENARDAYCLIKEFANAFPDTIMEYALYCFRDLGVAHPDVYVQAALRGHKVRQAALEISSIEQAIQRVADIANHESIFNDVNRIALPDEVLLFDTGNHRDKALLLYCLLRHAGLLSPAGSGLDEVLLGRDDAFVRIGDRFISSKSLSFVSRFDGHVVCRMLELAVSEPGRAASDVV